MAITAFAKQNMDIRTPAPAPAAHRMLRDAGRKARLTGVKTGNPMDDLLAVLPAALGRRLCFHEVTSWEPSFDELWLANIFDAIRQSDADRYRFAMLSRMSREQAARLHFMMCRAAYRLDGGAEAR